MTNNVQPLPKLPIGIQDFQRIRQGEVTLLGMNFSSETRNLENWCLEVIPARG